MTTLKSLIWHIVFGHISTAVTSFSKCISLRMFTINVLMNFHLWYIDISRILRLAVRYQNFAVEVAIFNHNANSFFSRFLFPKLFFRVKYCPQKFKDNVNRYLLWHRTPLFLLPTLFRSISVKPYILVDFIA